MNIQWYPGHMAKAKREIAEHLKLVDVIIELVDARIPHSSRNPEFSTIHQKPGILAVTKTDLADPKITKLWVDFWHARTEHPILLEIPSGKGISRLVQEVGKHKVGNRPPRALVIGIPNVGKSSLINRLAKKSRAKVGAKPGVTRGRQWINAGMFQLLDTPGILWPKFENQEIARRLALVYAIRDEILDQEELSKWLIDFLRKNYPKNLSDRYKLTSIDGNLLEVIGKKRGCLRSGGVVDILAAAKILLDDFRNGRLGQISLDHPSEVEEWIGEEN